MKKSTRNIFIAIFSVLFVVLFSLVGVLVYRSVSDSDDKKTTGANAIVGNSDNNGGGSIEPEADYEEGSRTIMVYMIGSDLETDSSMGTADIKEMMKAEFGDNIRIIIQTGGALNWHMKDIKDGEVQRSEIKSGEFIKLESLGKVNMALGETLTDFIKFAREEYPAETYTLVMWDHGGSAPISFGIDEVFEETMLTDAQIGEAIDDSGVSFDVIIMDACNMCTLEMAMAVRDNADYYVAAESTVIGTGLYYTDWLNYLGKNEDASTKDYCEMIIKDYMDTAKKWNSAASMSYIDLSKIENVYDAYEAYVDGVYDDIKDGEYADYILARKRSGLYNGTDSVDLISLAKKYRTDESSELISAVREAVCYNESDYEYGHGLAAYSPNAEVNKYNEVRESLEMLEYDEDVIDCYDALVTIKYAYIGGDGNSEFAREWYDDKIVRMYDIKPSEEDIEIDAQKINGKDAICLTEEQWSVVDSIGQQYYYMIDEQNIILFGEQRYDNVDNNGNIILEMPKTWICVGGYMASYICSDYYEDSETGEWTMSGGCFARCNGKEVLLFIQHDNDNPNGKIIGYALYDFDTMTIPSGRARIMNIDEDDEVELIYPVIDATTKTVSYKNVIDRTFTMSELKVGYMTVSFDKENSICGYSIEDIYGNEYETGAVR